MTYCTGKCGLKKDVIGISSKGYALGYKKCRECGIMYDTDEQRCFCCKNRLGVKPRNKGKLWRD